MGDSVCAAGYTQGGGYGLSKVLRQASTRATQGPEEVGVLLRVGSHDRAVGALGPCDAITCTC